MRDKLTAERLRELLHYDPETGVFTNRVRRRHYAAGTIAGAIRPSGYRQIGVDGLLYLSHRLAWLYVHGKFPDATIDHINRDPQDNRLCNLRAATYTENLRNRSVNRANRSGFKGVRRKRKRWEARIGVTGREITLGYFATPEEAHAAYMRAAETYHGEFAWRPAA